MRSKTQIMKFDIPDGQYIIDGYVTSWKMGVRADNNNLVSMTDVDLHIIGYVKFIPNDIIDVINESICTS